MVPLSSTHYCTCTPPQTASKGVVLQERLGLILLPQIMLLILQRWNAAIWGLATNLMDCARVGTVFLAVRVNTHGAHEARRRKRGRSVPGMDVV